MSTGYKGRVGVYELFRLVGEVRELIEREAPFADLVRDARAAGMRSMLEDGIDKAKLGFTSIDEVAKLHATVDIPKGEDSLKLSA